MSYSNANTFISRAWTLINAYVWVGANNCNHMGEAVWQNRKNLGMMRQTGHIIYLASERTDVKHCVSSRHTVGIRSFLLPSSFSTSEGFQIKLSNWHECLSARVRSRCMSHMLSCGHVFTCAKEKHFYIYSLVWRLFLPRILLITFRRGLHH